MRPLWQTEILEGLERERETGFADSSVFGGFARFALTVLSRHLARSPRDWAGLERLLYRYVAATPGERENLAGQIRDALVAGGGTGSVAPEPLLKPAPTGQSRRTRLPQSAGGRVPEVDEPPESWSVERLKGVGQSRVRLLARMGVETVSDLVWYFPRDYHDRSSFTPLNRLSSGESATLAGTVVRVDERRPRPRLLLFTAEITDSIGSVSAVWFNQPWVARAIRPGMSIVVTGKVEMRYGRLQIANPEWDEIDGEGSLHAGRIVPVYRVTQGVSTKWLRGLVAQVLDLWGERLKGALPAETEVRLGLPSLATALREMHFPTDEMSRTQARRRLVIEELFVLQAALAVERDRARPAGGGITHQPNGPLVAGFLEHLPYRLTAAQRRVLDEIFGDMESNTPMNRLLQGDVGSGKTVVAAAALVKTVESGYQGVIMAPTEILAEQHYARLVQQLGEIGVSVGLITGRLVGSERQEVLRRAASGELQVLIGTQALIQEEVTLARAGLVIIDEQHRFGVRQRSRLVGIGKQPDVLVMTATPIPRTMALTVYGDLDLSVIDELPPGRRPVITRWVRGDQREQVYAYVRKRVEAGEQAYVVCPLVEESEKLEVAAATAIAEELAGGYLAGLRLGLLHGRLPASDKERVMDDFRAGELQVLVATSVIEVGVDVPRATTMVIEGAERYGLASLHQLRGRVGRGSQQSYCILISDPQTEEGRKRLEAMVSSTDGFVIAEEDLKLRGPGEFFGTRQHGLPDLRVTNVLTDVEELKIARREAFQLIANDPDLRRPENRGLRNALARLAARRDSLRGN